MNSVVFRLLTSVGQREKHSSGGNGTVFGYLEFARSADINPVVQNTSEDIPHAIDWYTVQTLTRLDDN